MIRGAPGAWDSAYHAPVLADEIVELFSKARNILDCTLGGGGHSAALLALGATVTAIDRDPEAVKAEWRENLIPGAILVPSGIYALIRAQNAGCAFMPGT